MLSGVFKILLEAVKSPDMLLRVICSEWVSALASILTLYKTCGRAVNSSDSIGLPLREIMQLTFLAQYRKPILPPRTVIKHVTPLGALVVDDYVIDTRYGVYSEYLYRILKTLETYGIAEKKNISNDTWYILHLEKSIDVPNFYLEAFKRVLKYCGRDARDVVLRRYLKIKNDRELLEVASLPVEAYMQNIARRKISTVPVVDYVTFIMEMARFRISLIQIFSTAV